MVATRPYLTVPGRRRQESQTTIDAQAPDDTRELRRGAVGGEGAFVIVLIQAVLRFPRVRHHNCTLSAWLQAENGNNSESS